MENISFQLYCCYWIVHYNQNSKKMYIFFLFCHYSIQKHLSKHNFCESEKKERNKFLWLCFVSFFLFCFPFLVKLMISLWFDDSDSHHHHNHNHHHHCHVQVLVFLVVFIFIFFPILQTNIILSIAYIHSLHIL